MIPRSCRQLPSLLAALVLFLAMSLPAPTQALATSSPAVTQALAMSPPALAQAKVVFLGDSLTAGYGVAPDEAFPALVQRRIDELGWDFEVVNAGVPGDTSAGGLRRIDWVLRSDPAVVVVELGANDALRGLPVHQTRQNLQGIVDGIRESDAAPRIVIAGMLAPPNLGDEYTEAFASIFPELAAANDAALIPFLLEGVAAHPDLNLSDGIHPDAEGHRVVASNVWRVLKPELESLR